MGSRFDSTARCMHWAHARYSYSQACYCCSGLIMSILLDRAEKEGANHLGSQEVTEGKR